MSLDIAVSWTIEKKRCSKCLQELPLDKFGPSSGGVYLRPECRECGKKLSKERDILRKTTPLPPTDYHCPGCLRTEEEAKGCGGKKVGTWCLDHNHKTGKGRDWLCHDCNRKIGDDPEELIRLSEYLKAWEKKHNESL